MFGGVDDTYVADSGIVYLIANAGLLGFCIYPLLASGVLDDEDVCSPVATSMLFYLMVALTFGYQRSHLRTGVKGVAHPDLGEGAGQSFDHLVVPVPTDHDAGQRGAHH